MKIIAIGGGKRSLDNRKYELKTIDKEIIKITEKKRPIIIYIGHAKNEYDSNISYEIFSSVFYKNYNCICKELTLNYLKDIKYCEEIISKSDIIYVGGGDTKKMIDIWAETHFDQILEKAYLSNKVLCGLSAGAGCWFEYIHTDSKNVEKDEYGFGLTKGLGFIKGTFVPHSNFLNRELSAENRYLPEPVYMVTNSAAIEIINNRVKVLYGSLINPYSTQYIKIIKDNFTNDLNHPKIKKLK